MPVALWLRLPPLLSDQPPGGRRSPRRAGAFLPHQALYELSLLIVARLQPRSTAARGRILYNFPAAPAKVYTSEFRQVSELDAARARSTLSDLRSTSWEDGAGKSYRFKTTPG